MKIARRIFSASTIANKGSKDKGLAARLIAMLFLLPGAIVKCRGAKTVTIRRKIADNR